MDIPMAETNGVITVLVVINYQSFTVYSYLQASPFHLFKKKSGFFFVLYLHPGFLSEIDRGSLVNSSLRACGLNAFSFHLVLMMI